MNLQEVSIKFKNKLSKIKVCAFDIDGVLTPGMVWWDKELGFNRSTHTSDGYGLKLLMEAGIYVGVISGGKSIGVEKRFIENLNLNFTYLGNEDKREAYQKILDLGYKDEEILYMGDEFFDIPLLKRAGFSACVDHSSFEVKQFVDYIPQKSAGNGAVREIIDILRYAKDIFPKIKDFDGSIIAFKS